MNKYLTLNSGYHHTTIKRYIEREGVLPMVCSACGVEKVYNGKPITLQLHHINGNNKDNRLENLTMLCPNCHSQTNNYAGGNKKRG